MSCRVFDSFHHPLPPYQRKLALNPRTNWTAAYRIEQVLLGKKTRCCIGQDTNTVLAGGLAASKLQIIVGHVEAGLRSLDRNMPEETNRILTDHLADLLFAPTSEAVDNLMKEGISADKIFMTGNTIVDAVIQHLAIAGRVSRVLDRLHLSEGNYFLSTVHRPENVDCRERLVAILQSFRAVCERFSLPLILPIHPRTRKMLRTFNLTLPPQVFAIEPVGYLDFLQLEANAKLILTDSGGVQEEACILQVPCVTLRDNTERPETVMIGANIVAGVQPEGVVTCTGRMLSVPRD
jgi:UDP-N-acetylglucosamine 2-epimerase (non-hydrolysing)